MKVFLLSALAAVLAMGSYQTAKAEKGSAAETTGVGAGAVIGGAVGGPPGVILGAAFGGWLGDRFHQKQVVVETLTSEVETRDQQIGELADTITQEQHDARMLRRELTALDESGARELHRLLNKGLEFDLPFRTAEYQLPEELGTRITDIAILLSGTPDLAVQIDGYADPRGSVEYNAALSLQRAEAVRVLLTDAGMDASRITTFGHGESMTADSETLPHVDQLALQRRVKVTFYRDESNDIGVALLDSTSD